MFLMHFCYNKQIKIQQAFCVQRYKRKWNASVSGAGTSVTIDINIQYKCLEKEGKSWFLAKWLHLKGQICTLFFRGAVTSLM